MVEINFLHILLIALIVMLLFYIVRLKMVLGERRGENKKQLEELENKLAAAQEKYEEHQAKVNDHFMKTSMLFSQMTENYKAVYTHLADGSEDLCTDDAALLNSGKEFLSLSENKEDAPAIDDELGLEDLDSSSDEYEEYETLEEETVAACLDEGGREDDSKPEQLEVSAEDDDLEDSIKSPEDSPKENGISSYPGHS